MFASFRQFLASPRISDEHTARTANLLNAVMLTLMGLLTVMALSNFLSRQESPWVIVIELAVVVILMVMRYLLFRGYVEQISIALIAILSLAIPIGIAVAGTIRAPIVSTYVVVIVTAGLILQRNGLIATIGANAASITLLIIAEAAGMLPEPNFSISIIQWVTLISVILYAGALTFWSRNGITSALLQAQSELYERRRLEAGLEHEVAKRTDELRTALSELQAQAVAQQQLLNELAQQREVIRELSMPVLPIGAGTLVLPLVGALDSTRLEDLQTQALSMIERTRARRLLLDITGLPIVDTQVARGLIDVVAAARLLGAQTALVGVRPEVAQTIVGLGLDLRDIPTYADLEMALRGAG